jgi:hypothetical protein
VITDLTTLLIVLPVLLVYLTTIGIAAARPKRYPYLWQALPYMVVAVITASIGNTDKPYDMLGFLLISWVLTWIIVFATRKQWGQSPN